MNLEQTALMPSEPKPIVILGSGAIVRHAHLPAYRIAGFEVAAVYDQNQETARSLAKDFGIELVHKDLRRATDYDPAGNVFDLAVPAIAIPEILEKLPNGSFVLIQKPMGENLEQARHIEEICRTKNIRAAVNFQLRYAPYMMALRSALRQSLIGDILEVDCKVTVHMPWEQWDFLRHAPRMEIVYHSIHYLDFVRCILGEPRGVKANTIQHPLSADLHSSRSAAILDYGPMQRAQIVTYHGHRWGPLHQESSFRIEGTEGCAIVQMGLNLDYPKGGEDQLSIWTRDSRTWVEVPPRGSWFPHAFIGTMASVQRWHEDPTQVPETAISDAINTMRLVEACYLSSEEPGTAIP